MTFKNVGSSTASNVTATLSCNTAGITITDNTEAIASLSASSSLTRNGAYAFSIANNVSNGTVAAFTITMVSGSETWTHNFNITLNAPVLALGTMSVNDASGNNNGRLDPGETVTISIPLTNSGEQLPCWFCYALKLNKRYYHQYRNSELPAIAASGSAP